MTPYILTGGEGTRLRPLTAFTPKPLVKINGETPLDRLFSGLRRAGFQRATLCTCYRADDLRSALGSSRKGIKLRFCEEKSPLGTAGAVRAAWSKDDALILSGDSVCMTDYSAAIEFHRANRADVTMIAKRVDDPREYGLITVSEEGRITGFIEKPGFDRALTDLANTGAYIISEEIMSKIHEGEKLDFAKDIFPELLKEGKRLYAYIDSGFWYDIGDIPSLLRCQRELLQAEGKEVYLDKGVTVGEGSVVSGGTAVESGAAIGSSSRVLSSLIGENASIAPGADICEAVVCKGVAAGERLIMKRFSALGEGCVAGSDVTVCEGARVAPNTVIPDGAVIRTDITSVGFSGLSFYDGGEVRGLSDAADLMRFGASLGTAFGPKPIVIGGSGHIWEAAALGIRSAGVSVYRLSGAAFGETVQCSRRLGCSYCLFAGESLRLISPASGELSRQEERAVEQIFNRGNFRSSFKPARLINAEAEQEIYLEKLRGILPEKPTVSASLRTDDPREAEIFSSCVGESEGEEVIFSVARDRTTVTALAGGEVIPYEDLTVLCCRYWYSRRRSVCLPKTAPTLCYSLARQSRSGAIKGGELSAFCLDPIELCFTVIRAVSDGGLTLTEAVAALPKTFYTKRVIETKSGLPKILREAFPQAKAGEDISLESGGARGVVSPQRSGRGISLYVESVSQEAAEELCADIEHRLKELDKGGGM